ncbi:hypothetical protein EON79_15445 [bacterium]|nr:MAG: hypothetical protein EON79_15445 [bacterium]
MRELLEAAFPEFDWRMSIVTVEEVVSGPRVEPVALLDILEGERDARRWDFAFALTDADLESHYGPFALAAPSQVFGAGVISAARLRDADEGDTATPAVLARRILALALALFGHLNDLDEDEDDRSNPMHPIETPAELDLRGEFSTSQVEAMLPVLAKVADERIEEGQGHARGSVAFLVRAAGANVREIGQAVRRARPWLFPVWLSRLTTAALSTLLVLVVTAEAWELGMSQTWTSTMVLSTVSLLATSVYILKRQRLLVRRHGRVPTEQRVVANVSMVLTVIAGMSVTYVLLFALTWLLGIALLNPVLIRHWGNLPDDATLSGARLLMAGFVAALGIGIGALGAAFEGRSYFRHVLHVDREF